ncbi:uncharacterized protein TNCV_4871281 [Trichonephila clavipes]|nr:uncharacterized protein TNCV_4871281 [Trichonephila clavipes]
MFNLVCKPDEALASYMASEGIDWKFLPPRAPNFGGLWEAGVKSFKFYLKRVVGNIRLTYEEFLTVIIQIEGMLNSRPLVPLSSDLDDLNVLTPSHFLIGRSITSIVEPDLTYLNENRLDNWQKITKIIQLIWKRWSVDYLNSLQQRNKWHFEKKNAKIGDMVIIKEDNLPSCQWSLGRINNIYPGKDSKVRVVEVKTTRDSSENFCEIIDIPLFSSVLKQHVLCVKCKKQGIDIKFGRQIQGLATELLIYCEFCGLIQPLLNTRFTNTVVNKKDTKMYEMNTRLAYAMRSVGKGEAAAKVFCGVMNLPPPPKRFYESLHALNNATEKVAKVSMALAAAETLSFNNGNPNVPVAIDGTWQKRGHTSLNCVVMAVSVDTGKVVDAEILSRKCSCHFNGNLHSDECSANYFGNSGGMEVEAYKAVLESKPYKDVNIEKLECVGHVEKRMGTRLRALKLKGKKLEDKKSLGGRNRLTDAEVDKLQRYYGLAIRNNSGNLSAMKQAIWAIFFHKISAVLNPQHGLCPLGDDSWCGYNRSKLKGDTYKHKHNLPIAIMHCIKKVFRDLSSPELLSRCLHGKTQNCNESLNSVIWSIIPKTVFVQLGTLKTGVYESISIYNQGLITKLKVLDLLNIQPGFYTCRALQEADHARIRKAEKAISRRTKEARIKNRQLKCRQEDDLSDDPSNPSYGSGMY